MHARTRPLHTQHVRLLVLGRGYQPANSISLAPAELISSETNQRTCRLLLIVKSYRLCGQTGKFSNNFPRMLMRRETNKMNHLLVMYEHCIILLQSCMYERCIILLQLYMCFI